MSLSRLVRPVSRVLTTPVGHIDSLLHSCAMLSTTSSSATSTDKFSLPPLPYEYNALEPAISGQIMETHHKKHHQTYVNNLNAAIEQYKQAQQKGDLTKQITLQSAIRFNGGGHLNHSIFWTNLAPKQQGGGQAPTGEFAKQVESDFGSLDSLISQMSSASTGIQGSGWGWLGWNATMKRLEITTKSNQDPLTEYTPLLGLDVWEHAYYYLYGPARAEYVKQIWTVVNWKNVAERFQAAKTQTEKK